MRLNLDLIKSLYGMKGALELKVKKGLTAQSTQSSNGCFLAYIPS
jgi:hypothetical protein